MSLAAWSLRLGARALANDPLDAWGLELDVGAESRPTFCHKVKL